MSAKKEKITSAFRWVLLPAGFLALIVVVGISFRRLVNFVSTETGLGFRISEIITGIILMSIGFGIYNLYKKTKNKWHWPLTALIVLILIVLLPKAFGRFGDFNSDSSVKQKAELAEEAKLMASKLPDFEKEMADWLEANRNQPQAEHFSAKLLPSTDFSFRGVKFGFSKEEIRSAENSHLDTLAIPMELGGDSLAYYYYISTGVLAILGYTLDDDQALVSIYINFLGPPLSPSEAASILSTLLPYFKTRFGEPLSSGDLAYGWSRKDYNIYFMGFPNTKTERDITPGVGILYATPKFGGNKNAIEMRDFTEKYLEEGLSFAEEIWKKN